MDKDCLLSCVRRTRYGMEASMEGSLVGRGEMATGVLLLCLCLCRCSGRV